MPVVSITLDDTNRTILNQAYYKIVQDIVDRIKIPHTSLVVLQKDMEVTLTDNKTNVSGPENINLPSTVSNRRVLASITENYNEDELTTTAVHQNSAYPIFIDHDISVFVYPIYVKSDIVIEFSYISPSKIEASKIRDDIRLRLSQTRNIDIHELEYSILIPEVVEEFIADVYDLKSRLVPQSLEDYFREHATKRIYPITDMSNIENVKLAIHEKQIRIVGVYDFSSMPEKIEQDNENSTYKVSFSYKLSMDVPRAIVMKYPVMICNRPLPSKYLSFIEDNKVNSKEEYKKELNYTSNSLFALSHFEAHRQLENRVDIELPINIPSFDEFNLRQGYKGYGLVASFLTQVDETDLRSLFNLKEIDPYQIPEFLLDYIRDVEKDYITKPNMSFIYLGLHQDGKYFDSSKLIIDTDFNIKSTVDLTLLNLVRVTIGIIIDLSSLNNKAINRALPYPRVFCAFINEYINAYNNFKTELFNNIPDPTFLKILITAFEYYINKDWDSGINCLLVAVSRDKFLFNAFYNEIINSSLYRRLLGGGYMNENTLSDIKKSFSLSTTSSNNNIGTETGFRKTVMTTYVIVGNNSN